VIVHNPNMQELEHPSTHLTDNYKKDKNSNNYKLLDLGHQEHKEIMRTLRLIEAWRDIDNAEGFTLDKIGKNVLEMREGRADPEYRKAIKIKIRSNLSAGLVEDFNVILEILFGGNFNFISETWHQEKYNYEPAGNALSLSNLSNSQLLELSRVRSVLSEIKAGGVRLVWDLNWLLPFSNQNINNFLFNQFKWDASVHNITRPTRRGNRWDGTFLFDGSENWNGGDVYHCIHFPLFKMLFRIAKSTPKLETSQFFVSGLKASNVQKGISGRLLVNQTTSWDGKYSFDGSISFTGKNILMEEVL